MSGPALSTPERLSRTPAAASVILAASAAYCGIEYLGWWYALTASIWWLALGLVLWALVAVLAYLGSRRNATWAPGGISLDEGEATRLVAARSSVRVDSEAVAIAAVGAVSEAMAERGFRVRSGPRVAELATHPRNRVLVPAVYWLITLALLASIGGRLARHEQSVDLPLGETVVLEPAVPSQAARGLALTALDVVESPDGAATTWVTLASPDAVVASGRVGERRSLRAGSRLVTWERRGISAVLTVETSAGPVASRLPYLLGYPAEGTSTLSSPARTAFAEDGRALAETRVRLEVAEENAPLSSVPATATAVVSVAPAGTDAFGAETPLELGETIQLDGGYHLRFAVLDDWVRLRVTEDRWPPLALPLLGVATLLLVATFFIAPRRAIVGAVHAEAGEAVNVLVTDDAPTRAFSRRVLAEVSDAVQRLSEPGAAGERAGEDPSDEE